MTPSLAPPERVAGAVAIVTGAGRGLRSRHTCRLRDAAHSTGQTINVDGGYQPRQGITVTVSPDFAGQVILVTGGASGLGFAIANLTRVHAPPPGIPGRL